MALTVTKEVVWAGDLPDQPGGLAEKLGALAAAGVSLGFVIARRRPEAPGKGVVFVAPLAGRAAQNAAKAAGLSRAEDVPTLRVEGPDRPGIGERMLRAMADLGINIRGFSAGVIGRSFVAYIGFDRPEDANKAARALKALDAGTKAKTTRRTATR